MKFSFVWSFVYSILIQSIVVHCDVVVCLWRALKKAIVVYKYNNSSAPCFFFLFFPCVCVWALRLVRVIFCLAFSFFSKLLARSVDGFGLCVFLCDLWLLACCVCVCACICGVSAAVPVKHSSTTIPICLGALISIKRLQELVFRPLFLFLSLPPTLFNSVFVYLCIRTRSHSHIKPNQSN